MVTEREKKNRRKKHGEKRNCGEEKTSTINISQKERKKKRHFCGEGRGCYFLKGERVFREQRSSWHSICDSKNEKKKTQKKVWKIKNMLQKTERDKNNKKSSERKKQKIKRMNISINYLRNFPEMRL